MTNYSPKYPIATQKYPTVAKNKQFLTKKIRNFDQIYPIIAKKYTIPGKKTNSCHNIPISCQKPNPWQKWHNFWQKLPNSFQEKNIILRKNTQFLPTCPILDKKHPVTAKNTQFLAEDSNTWKNTPLLSKKPSFGQKPNFWQKHPIPDKNFQLLPKILNYCQKIPQSCQKKSILARKYPFLFQK